MSAPARPKSDKRSPKELDALARAYYEASKRGVDMHAAVNALASIRDALVTGGMSLASWDRLDQQIGMAQDRSLRDVVVELRSTLVEHFTEKEVARMSEKLRRDPDAGWDSWLPTFGDALARWRLEFCCALTRADIPFPSAVSDDVAMLAAGAEHALRREWVESYVMYKYVANAESVSKHTRAEVCVTAAEICMYWFSDLDRAKRWLEQGDELDAEAGRVVSGWGDYLLQLDDTEAATKQLQRALNLNRANSDACVSMGEIYQRAGNIDSAEDWYRRAVEVDPGNPDGYRSRIDIHGNPDRFAQGEPKIASLYETIAAVNPSTAYDACLDVSRAYQQNERSDDAVAWAQRAIELDPTRPGAYAQKGDVLAGSGRIEEAERAYLDGVKMAGESFDSHWSLAWFYHGQQQWTEALEAFENSLRLRPAWEAKVLASIGEVRMKLGQTAEAEAALFRVLELSPDDSSATGSLEDIASQYLQRDSAVEEPLRIYNRMLELKGEDYLGTRENLTANAYYYVSDFHTAAAHYGRAVEAKPENSVLHSNLALALEKLIVETGHREYLDRAIAELQRTLELEPESPSERDRLQGLQLQAPLFEAYGARVLGLGPQVVPVWLEVGSELLPFVSPDGSNLSDEIQSLVDEMNERILARYGIDPPNIRFRMLAEDQTGIAYSILINEVVVASEWVSEEDRFVLAEAEALQGKGIWGRPDKDPLTAEPGIWVDADDGVEARSLGFEVWEPLVYPMRHLEAMVRANLHALIGHDDVLGIADRGIYVGIDVGQPEGLTRLTKLLRGLLVEDVPLAPLAGSGVSAADRDPAAGVESLRSLKGMRSMLPVNGSRERQHLDSSVQERLNRHVIDEGSLLVLPRKPAEELIEEIESDIELGEAVVVVDDQRLRPFVRAFLDIAQVRSAVVTEAELDETIESEVARTGTGGGDGAKDQL